MLNVSFGPKRLMQSELADPASQPKPMDDYTTKMAYL